jgi:type I restriction enzyme, S subunit
MAENVIIPKYWEIKKLEDIGKIVSGGTPSTKVPDYWDGDVSWITPADLSGYNEKIIYKGRKSLTENGLKNSSARLMPKGSVLFSSRAPIGYIVIAGNEVCTNQGFKSIIPNDSISSDYLFYYLNASKQKAEKVASGTTFKEISLKAFSQLEISIPPLPEQYRIVAKIEELFNSLDKGIESLKTSKQQLKVFRQAVLKWAFEGRFTNKTVHEGELPKGWKWISFSQLVNSSQNGISKRNSKEGKEFKVLRLSDIELLSIDYSLPRYIRLSKDEIDKYKLYEGDLVCIRVNGSKDLVGRLILVKVRDEYEDWAFCDHFIRFTPEPKAAFQAFLFYYFQLSIVRKFVQEYMVSSAGQNTVSQGTIKSVMVPLPPLPEQHTIVAEIESRLSVCDKMEESITQSLEQSEALRQSILKKAFEGRLVPQEPNDEPASVLLERIKAEREKSAAEQRNINTKQKTIRSKAH